MKLSIKLQKIKAGWSIVHTEGSQVKISKQKYCIYYLLIDLSYKTIQTLMKYRIVRFLIWIFTVYQNTRLGISGILVTLL